MPQGVGQLDIGIGQGAAQVFNPNPAIQQYAQNLAQNKAKHEAEVKQLGDELAKGYDPAGLRNDADRSAYIKQYNDIKQSAIDAENEKDKTKKALALAQVRQKLSDLGSFSEGSKKQGIFERQLAMEHLKNPYLYDDDTAQKILAGKDKVWNDNGVIKDASQVVRGVDPSKVDAEFQKNLKNWANTQKWQDVKKDDVVAGNKGQWTYQQRGIPLTGDNGLLEDTMNFATSNKDFQKYLHDTYPNIQGNDDPSTLSLRAAKYLHDKGYGNGYSEQKDNKFNRAKNEELTPGERLSAYHWSLEHNKDGSPKYGAGGQNATAITAENVRNSTDPKVFVPLIKSALPQSRLKNGDVSITTDIDPKNGQTVHVFSFPNKLTKQQEKENDNLKSSYPKTSIKGDKIPGSENIFGVGKKFKPFEQSETYKQKYHQGDKQEYRISTADPQSYDLQFADMLKDQGASDAEINKILGKTGVNPVHLGENPKQEQKKKTTDLSSIFNH